MNNAEGNTPAIRTDILPVERACPSRGYVVRTLARRNTCAYWNAILDFTPVDGEIIVYSDYKTLDGKDVPGVKIGTGNDLLQDIPFLDDYDAAQIAAKYTKPAAGIPKADLDSTVQASLDKADASASEASFQALQGRVGDIEDVIPAGTSVANPLVNESSLDNITDRVIEIEKVIPAEATLMNPLTDRAYVNSAVAVCAGKIEDIEDLIPAQTSTSNPLADKAFVNSSVQTATANFRGNWETIDDVPIHASEYPADYAGGHTPTVNDYLVVRDMEDIPEWTSGETYSTGAVVMYQDYAYICIYDDGVGAFTSFLPPDEETDKWQQWLFWEQLEGTWRFKYTGNWDIMGKAGWQPEYQVNETPLTAAQLAALNSGITSNKVSQYDGYAQSKQDKLISGTNIKTLNGNSLLGAGDVTNFSTELNEVEFTDIVEGRIYRAFAGGTSVIGANLLSEGIRECYVFNPSDVEVELECYESYGDYGSQSTLVYLAPMECVLLRASYVGPGDFVEWTIVRQKSEVFVATYNTTTAAEIISAYNAGKAVMCLYDNKAYALSATSYNSDTELIFSSIAVNYSNILRVNKSSNAWSSSQKNLEETANKTSDIANNSTSTSKYPNCKAVADYVQTAIFGAMSNSY